MASEDSEAWRVEVELQHSLVQVAELTGKGRGLVVSEGSIPAGTALIRERPLVVTATSDAEALSALSSALEADATHGGQGRFTHLCQLPEKSRTAPSHQGGAAHEAAQPGEKSSHPDAAQQVKANAFGGAGSGKSVTVSIFSAISFCNHSCDPNAALSRSTASRRGVVLSGEDSECPRLGEARTLYAIRDIAAGEEICICYDSDLLWLPEPARRQHTLKVWAFQCGCQRCSNDRQLPDLDSFTGIERYYDALGKLTSGVVMRPHATASDSQPCVVDIYEEANQFYGPSHWRTHAARETSLRVYLEHAAQDFDFDMLLEHLQEIERLVPPTHPYFLTWFATMQQIVRSNEGIGSEPEWQETIHSMQELVDNNVPQDVLNWNDIYMNVTGR